MKKFIVIYHANVDAMAQMENVSPEQAQEGMKAWMAWAEQCGEHMVDLGSPLAGGQRLNVGGSSVDSDRDVTGYTVLQAESIEKVKELLRGHPHLSGWDDSCTIEVHEAMPLPSAM